MKYPQINTVVIRSSDTSKKYWVSEVDADLGRVLIRTIEENDVQHDDYQDYWVNVHELVFDKKSIQHVRKAFDDRLMAYSQLSHQDLSNIIWFDRIFRGTSDSNLAWIELENRFNKELLPYKPSREFKEEINALTSLGAIMKDNTIHYDGEIVGEVVTEHTD